MRNQSGWPPNERRARTSAIRSSPKPFTWVAMPDASSVDADHRVGGHAPEEGGERVGEVAGILRLERDLHTVLRIRELGVGAEQQRRELGQQGVEVLGEAPLPDAEEDVLQVEGLAAEPLLDGVELLPEDLRHARQHVDVAREDDRE